MTLLLAETGYEVHAVVVGPMDNNVFVIRCTETGDGVLIDAANEHERLLELCTALGVRRVIETHGHWDHIQAVPAIRDAGYDVAVTAADSEMLEAYDSILEDDNVIEVGRLRLIFVGQPEGEGNAAAIGVPANLFTAAKGFGWGITNKGAIHRRTRCAKLAICAQHEAVHAAVSARRLPLVPMAHHQLVIFAAGSGATASRLTAQAC
jgi:hypothetical protein